MKGVINAKGKRYQRKARKKPARALLIGTPRRTLRQKIAAQRRASQPKG